MRISDWSSDVCSSDLFLLVEFGEHTARIEQSLLDRGVVLRPMAGYGLPQCSRISVGSAEENRRLLAALDDFLARSPGLARSPLHRATAGTPPASLRRVANCKSPTTSRTHPSPRS